MEMRHYLTYFMDSELSDEDILSLDNNGLRDLGVTNKSEREKVRKKIKELKALYDKDKKEMEKERKRKDSLLKKAEKANKKKWQRTALDGWNFSSENWSLCATHQFNADTAATSISSTATTATIMISNWWYNLLQWSVLSSFMYRRMTFHVDKNKTLLSWWISMCQEIDDSGS